MRYDYKSEFNREIERKNSINKEMHAFINYSIAIFAANIYLFDEYIEISKNILDSFFVLSGLSILSNIFFIFLAGYGFIFQPVAYMNKPSEIEDYYKKISNLHKDPKEIEKEMEEFLQKRYCLLIDHNIDVNDSRSENFFNARIGLGFSLIFLIMASIIYALKLME